MRLQRSLASMAICFGVVTFLLLLNEGTGKQLPFRRRHHGRSGLPWVVVGDWGTGDDAQMLVASALGNVANKLKPAFVVSTGDQLYPAGASSVDSLDFESKFERVYPEKHPGLRVPWYMALGNHDCVGDPDAEVLYSNRSKHWVMPARYYARSVDVPNCSLPLRIVVLDACALVCEGPAGSGVNFRCDQEILDSLVPGSRSAQLEWLDAELAKPAQWKVVVAHWPLFSFLGNGPSSSMTQALLPMLLRHGVHAYFSGHDHSLQHIELRRHARAGSLHPPHFFVSGAGGYRLHPELKAEAEGEVNSKATPIFKEATHGFMMIHSTRHDMTVDLIRAMDGKRLHTVVISPK